MNKQLRKFRLQCYLSLFFCILMLILSLCLGNRLCSPPEVLSALFHQGDRVTVNIILYARLPRVIACMAAGAALSLSGAVLQYLLGNHLASPGIIGVNAGAGLGITLCCACGVLSGWLFSLSAFLGSLLTLLLIVLLSGKSLKSRTSIILCGVVMNTLLNAVSESITVLDPDIAALTTEFRVGGFSSVSMSRLIPAVLLILLCILVVLTLHNELDVLRLGDDHAAGLGLNVRRYRLIFLSAAALLAGCAVSFAGLLGFVGLIVPHFVRRFTGPRSGYFLPVCALSGAWFLAFCDLLARMLFMPYELPVGILMALIGGPLFILILVRLKGGNEYA